ncbi:MAG: ATP synthase F1 subunit gamma [Clostridia bacterium]|nr:ATP synthase F1 subunit gamma [Clostridia bacterium]
MAQDIKSLRTRIKSVTSTLHLTKAMGLVASSKIRRATEAMNKGRQYEAAVRDAVSLLTQSPECAKSPYMQKKDGGKTEIVVIAGDRGLAGGYNANVFRLAKEYANAEYIGIGKRACDRYGTKLLRAEGFSYSEAMEIAKKLCDDFASGEYERIGIICTKYVSMMSQEAEIKWILPLEKTEAKQSAGVIFEPDELTILNGAVLEYVTGILVASVRESFTSEVAARRCAMDSAGKNAQEMIDSLSLRYNRARQSAITQEITEIVAGSGEQ